MSATYDDNPLLLSNGAESNTSETIFPTISILIAPPATALLEATWYALVRHIDFWEVLSANFDPDMSPRPSHFVALAGLAFFLLYAARNWRLRRASVVLAGAE
ncbi:MAG: hypothetical protein ACLPSW_25180 [Roseiarcus sp.]